MFPDQPRSRRPPKSPLPRIDPLESVEARPMMKTIVIEPVRAFNGMDVLVARDEGLFVVEGLDLRIASHRPDELHSSAEGRLERPLTNQGGLLERGEAHMFQG
jgi:hypothetical protein